VFVLPVGFSVVTNDPVSIGRGRTLGVRGNDLSVERVVESLEETLAQVHITDRVDWVSKVYAARKLTVAVAPMVLNTF
jgi:hypothetical protein